MREMAPPLELTGLRPAPAQTFGAFRLIPLLRETPCEDVRLSRAVISPGVKTVDLPGRKSYTAFVPHGLRLTWGSAAGTQVKEQDTPGEWQFLESVHRLRKKDGEDALRFLPRTWPSRVFSSCISNPRRSLGRSCRRGSGTSG